MSSVLMSLLSFSILVPTICSILKLKIAEKNYQPFFVLIFVALLVEITSTILYFQKIGNAAVINFFVLFEFICWLKLFINLRLSNPSHYTSLLIKLGIVGGVLWIADNFIKGDITAFNVWFKLYYSFILVFLALDHINVLIVYEKKSLLKNASFIFCVGILIFFCYKIFLEIVWQFGYSFSKELLVNVFTIQSFVNAFVNLIYAIAVIWIPTKMYFIRPL